MRKGKEDNITEILKLIAPGTPIRDGLENILRARTGALLLITDNIGFYPSGMQINNKSASAGGFFISDVRWLPPL